MITKLIYTYLVSFPIVMIIDIAWLGIVAKDLYHRLMSPAVTIAFNIPAAIAFYLLYVVGVFIFAVYPGIESQSLVKTIILASLFGFFCYMTYDLTNLATIEKWPPLLVVVDIMWGTFLSGCIGAIAYTLYFSLFS